MTTPEIVEALVGVRELLRRDAEKEQLPTHPLHT